VYMSGGNVSRKNIQDNADWIKIRTDYPDKTTYEIQNLGKVPITVIITFFDFENILFEAFRGAQFKGNATFAANVEPGATKGVVELYTKLEGQDWKFDYDLRVETVAAPPPPWM